MKKLPLFLFTFCCFLSFAQPSIQWQKSLGGSVSDAATSIKQTYDGGYIVGGWSASNDGDVTGNHGNGMIDYWIVKLNSVGNIQWQKCLGGTQTDLAWSIQQTTDSGYIVAGVSVSLDGDVTGNHGSNGLSDYWIVKLNSVGNIQWQKCLGGSGGDWANSIQQTTDGGYIVAGYSFSNDGDVSGNHGQEDYWVVKLDNGGALQWEKSLGGTGNERATAIRQTTDSGYIVAGWSASNDSDVTGNHGSDDYWIVKLNGVGTIQWEKSLGGTLPEEAYSIQQTYDGGYIVAGQSDSQDGDVTGNHGSDYWIVKLDSVGAIQWEKCWGGTWADIATSIQQTTDAGYIASGRSSSNDGDVTGNHGSSDYWIVKLDSVGALQWQKSMGGTGWDWGYSIQQTTDGGFIVAGWSYSNDSDVTVNHGTGTDYWVVKLNTVILGATEINHLISDIQIIPNPLSQSTVVSFSLNQSENISVNIYDITGRLIKNLFDGNLNPGEHQIKWNVNDAIEDGVYFLNLSSESFSRSCKLVVVK